MKKVLLSLCLLFTLGFTACTVDNAYRDQRAAQIGPDVSPIRLGPEGSRPIAFHQAIFNLKPGTEILSVRNGFTGRTESFDAADEMETSRSFEFIVKDELKKANYTLIGADSALFSQQEAYKARYQLGAEIRDMHWEIHHNPFFAVNEMDVAFQLYDTVENEVVFNHIYEADAFVDDPDAEDPDDQAFRKAMRKLLADRDFVDILDKKVKAEVKDTSDEYPLLTIDAPTEGSLDLPADLESVFTSVVLIKAGAERGAGFLISSSGYVLTAGHVVSGIEEVSVAFENGLELDAKVSRVNQAYDLALVKLPGKGYAPLTLDTEATAKTGQEIFAIGNPMGDDLSFSVAKGIISGSREIENTRLIQTDASVNPGNSGGPLLNETGQVIGVVSSKVVGVGIEGLAFAVPIEFALEKLNLELEGADEESEETAAVQ